ncbi:MAG TPA: CDP-2,3-bis-(O-geranylgeranyl)-sn-glycerol synthase [Candidatus Thermoplasmatota archaeon]|nr:CDP-2,3-bis-(O-geranylgeranyl)-sn-glycerol synthase [Candidatus Thermoplasmatota archaeon]
MAWSSILQALWLFLPAYVANMSPVFVAKLVPRWTAPIDGGRVGKDGQRILGPGKTWRGLVGATLAGGLTALLIAHVAPAEGSPGLFAGLDYGLKGHVVSACPPGAAANGTAPACEPVHQHASFLAVFLFGAILGLMALVGDFVKSYFKRRRKIERGGSWFPFDQLDFVVFGLLGMMLAAPLLPHGWVHHALLDDWVVLATLFVLTPLLHLLINRIGYWLGLKEVPW